MAQHNELGKIGEQHAAEFLVEKGYEILARNWRFGSDEIDIIARFNNTIVIVEVKTRQTTAFGEPEVFVNKQKQKFLIRAADVYINQHKHEEEVRFDIISVVLKGNNLTIEHIEDAFYPTIK